MTVTANKQSERALATSNLWRLLVKSGHQHRTKQAQLFAGNKAKARQEAAGGAIPSSTVS